MASKNSIAYDMFDWTTAMILPGPAASFRCRLRSVWGTHHRALVGKGGGSRRRSGE